MKVYGVYGHFSLYRLYLYIITKKKKLFTKKKKKKKKKKKSAYTVNYFFPLLNCKAVYSLEA